MSMSVSGRGKKIENFGCDLRSILLFGQLQLTKPELNARK